MKSYPFSIVIGLAAALCFDGTASAKDKREEMTVIPGGAHVVYTHMEQGKTSSGNPALVFTGQVSLNIRPVSAVNSIWAKAARIDVIPLALQYNVFGPGEVHVAGGTYKTDKAGAIFTVFQSGRRGLMEPGWHKA